MDRGQKIKGKGELEMDIQVIFEQMLMLFAMMSIGYYVWKKEWFDEAAYQKL